MLKEKHPTGSTLHCSHRTVLQQLHSLSWNWDTNQQSRLRLSDITIYNHTHTQTHTGITVTITDSRELNCEADKTPPVSSEWLLDTITPPLPIWQQTTRLPSATLLVSQQQYAQMHTH